MEKTCIHLLGRTKGCVLHTRCLQGDLIVKEQAKSLAECPDFQLPGVKKVCKHLGANTRKTVGCIPCGADKTKLFVYDCLLFGQCTLGKTQTKMHGCEGCERKELVDVVEK